MSDKANTIWTARRGNHTSPVKLTQGDHHTLALRARDLADNLSAVQTVAVGLDMQAPLSTAQLAGGRAPNGWYVTPVTVTLRATDDSGAGVASQQWRLNGGLWQSYLPIIASKQP